MSVNRYRLKHLAKHDTQARYALQLLARTDRLLGVILLCDTFADILASAVATLLAIHYFGELGIILATAILTIEIGRAHV